MQVPRLGPLEFFLKKPKIRLSAHVFDGEHYWEVGKKGFDVGQVARDFGLSADLLRTYRVPENPYHRFFMFKKF
jgi:predicted glycosyltransferase